MPRILVPQRMGCQAHCARREPGNRLSPAGWIGLARRPRVLVGLRRFRSVSFGADSRSAAMRVKTTLFVLLVASAGLAGQQNPYVGRWNITGTGPDTDKVYWLEVKQK